MDALESKMAEWRRRMPSKRALTSQVGKFVQEKSVQVLYTQSEQDRIKDVTALIAAATDAFSKAPHWDRILKVTDALAATGNRAVLKESVRFLRLRLGDPDPTTVLLALTLAEALVKNGGPSVHREMATEAFMGEMEAVYKAYSTKRGYEAMKIEARVLELVQAWGEAFMHRKFEYPYFIYTYERLRKKGARFPKYDRSKAPIFTPPKRRSSGSNSAAGSNSTSNSKSNSKTGNLAKLSSKEVYHVAKNVEEMLGDMLHEVAKDGGGIGEQGVVVELANQAQELVVRLQTVIQSVADNGTEEELGKYLAINDSLHTALMRYDDLKAGKGKQKASNQVTNDANKDNEDDEFGDFVRARVGGEEDKAVDNQMEDAGDDLFGDFVSARATKTSEPEPESKPAKEPVNDLINLWGDMTLDAAPASTPAAPVMPAQAAASTDDSDVWGSNPFDAASAFDTAAAPTPGVASKPTQASATPFDDFVVPPVSEQASATPFGDFAVSSTPAQPTATPFDELWGDAPIVPTPILPVDTAPAMPSQPTAAASNPFDFFDDLTAKPTISTSNGTTPITSTSSAASMPSIDPFADLTTPATTSAFMSSNQHPPSANPFDF